VTAYDVSVFMLGRYLNAYLIVKTDEQGSRVVNDLPTPGATLEKHLAQA